MKRRFRIIVRPWIPRRIPHEITEDKLEKTLASIYKNLDPVVYVGWKRRTINGKRVLQYILTTGSSAKEARKNFKELSEENKTFWIIS